MNRTRACTQFSMTIFWFLHQTTCNFPATKTIIIIIILLTFILYYNIVIHVLSVVKLWNGVYSIGNIYRLQEGVKNVRFKRNLVERPSICFTVGKGHLLNFDDHFCPGGVKRSCVPTSCKCIHIHARAQSV